MKKIFSVLLLTLAIPFAGSAQVRYADSVLAYSSQYGSVGYTATQALGAPNVYPAYGDVSNNWSPSTADVQREFIELRYPNPAPVSYVGVYETYRPGTVDTVYVRNSTTKAWQMVWSGTATAAPFVSRIFLVNFALTAYNVDAVRLAVNSPAVPGYNEIDAVGVSNAPITSVDVSGTASPTQFSLGQNFPNPFNPTTEIRFTIHDAGFTSLKVFDVLGREVAMLVNEEKPAGVYNATWNASAFPSGVYLYRLQTNTAVATMKMLLLK